MSTFEYKGNTFEVEARKMDSDTLNVVFIDESDFAFLMDWATNADLSRIEIDDDADGLVIYEGFTEFRSLTALQSTDADFWEGMRMVVALGKPNRE